jgi:hypothetical protein
VRRDRGSEGLVAVLILTQHGDVAAGQLAVFQGASEVPISEFIRAERATWKNSQLAAAHGVALKMGPAATLLVSCVSIQICALFTASPARTALPAAHFERNDVIIICETAH